MKHSDEQDELPPDGNDEHESDDEYGPSGPLAGLNTFWREQVFGGDRPEQQAPLPPLPTEHERLPAPPHEVPPPVPFPSPSRPSLFDQRYGMPPEPPSLPPAVPPAPQVPMVPPHPGQVAGHSFDRLEVLRSEDQRVTGRRWPGTPGQEPDPHMQRYRMQMEVALGEVDPRLLAREMALRYVRASHLGPEDGLKPTDIFSIIHFGLGLRLRQLDCTGLPNVLAVYSRGTREIYLDWKLLHKPPIGHAMLQLEAWRRAVDGSHVARVLLAWCAAVHLTDTYGEPLILGFAPVPAAQMDVQGPFQTNRDTLNRYRKCMEATATLLAPAERLWQQIATRPLGVQMGDPDWRDTLRRLYRHPHGGTQRRSHGQYSPAEDPVNNLLAMLGDANLCPPVLVEMQLDGPRATMDWPTWVARLMHELPQLQMRQVAAAKMFGLGGTSPGTGWAAAARMPDLRGTAVQLVL